MSEVMTQRKTRQQPVLMNEKIPAFIKDLGLLGFCIYVLWVDNDQNKTDIAALQQKNYQIELTMQTVTIQLQSIQEVNERQNNVLDNLIVAHNKQITD